MRQGYVLSPFLFLLVMDFVMQRTLTHGDYDLQREDRGRLADLDFADDIAFLGSIQPALCELMAAMGSEAEKARLRIYTSKIKILCIGYVCAHIPVQIDQQPLDEVGQFTYFGSVVTVDGGSDQDDVRRLGKAMAVMRQLWPIWLYNAIVLGTHPYTSETRKS